MKPINEFLSELLDLGIELWVEGDRLRYQSPEGVLTTELRAAISARKTEIITYLKQSDFNPQRSSQSIVPIPRDQDLPLSFGQQRLWFINQLDKNSIVYNESLSLKIEGRLQISILEQVIQAIWHRHELLRTTFSVVEGSPVQIIHPPQNLTLPIIDLQSFAKQEQWSRVEQLVNQQDQQPFNLESDRLLRLALIKLEENLHILSLTIHHIIADGSFMSIFIQEFTTLYEAFSQGKPSPLSKLSIQYADYAYWQRQRLQGELLEHHISYWKRQLADVPPYLELPTDRLRPPIQTFQGRGEPFQISALLTQKLKQLSQQSGVTLFMTLLAAFTVLLSRHTNQQDIVIGSPIANRNSTQLEGLLGFFVNNLILRIQLQPDLTFIELLRRVRQVSLDAFEHSEAPFEKIVDELQIERNLSYHPLFQVAFVLQNTPMWKLFQNSPDGKLAIAGLTLELLSFEQFKAKFDLTLELVELDQKLTGTFIYNTNLFEAETIQRMIKHFQILLESISSEPRHIISQMPLMPEEELQQILVEWNATQTNYPKSYCIHQLFEQQAAKTPDAIAFVYEDQQISYQELNQKANQLAHHLHKLGIGNDQPIGICVERSIDMLIGLVGILKAGGAYLPIDANYPNDRINYMLADAQVQILVTQQNLRSNFLNSQLLVIELDREWEMIAKESKEDLSSNTTAENIAYIIYTSGSTGEPKGVVVPHRAVNRLVINTNYIKLSPSDRVAQASNVSFDAATFEIWGALLNGAKLMGITKEVLLSPQKLANQIRQQQITTLFLTTALFNQVSKQIPDAFSPLSNLLFGGEASDPKAVREILEQGSPDRLLHVYGPTENTTFSSWYLVESIDEETTTIPIGKPIANSQMYILDRDLNLVPIGVRGEIYVSGDGLAKGYLNRPELTAEKFIHHSFTESDSIKLYKTGDLGRYLPDGNVEILGRSDFQVKIRGFRIELGEIETALRQQEEVRETIVIACDDERGSKQLVAYVVPKIESLAGKELKSFLKEKLPDYMIPAFFVFLGELPLTPNGKVDRRALPAPDLSSLSLESNFVPPSTSTEQAIAEVWQEILKIEKIGVHDNFFELGGHSLIATQVMSRLPPMFSLDLPLSLLFELPTIAELADRIDTILWASGDALGTSFGSNVDEDDDYTEGRL